MNEEEARAREICAYCNFTLDCMTCKYGRNVEEQRYVEDAYINLEKCKEWIYYRRNPLQTNYEKLKELIQSLLYKIGDFLFHD